MVKMESSLKFVLIFLKCYLTLLLVSTGALAKLMDNLSTGQAWREFIGSKKML